MSYSEIDPSCPFTPGNEYDAIEDRESYLLLDLHAFQSLNLECYRICHLVEQYILKYETSHYSGILFGGMSFFSTDSSHHLC